LYEVEADLGLARKISFAEGGTSVFAMKLWRNLLSLGSEGGLFFLDPVTGAGQSHHSVQGAVHALELDSHDRLWVGCESGALLCWTDPQQAGSLLPAGEGLEKITAMREDSEGTLWIGSYNQGMFRLRDGFVHKADFHDRFIKSRIFSLLEDREGSLWIGTHYGLVQVQDAPFKLLGAQDGIGEAVWSVQEAGDGRIWLATEGSGITILGPNGLQRLGPGQGLSSPDVIVLLAAPDGSMWAGTRKGLNQIEGTEVRRFGPAEGLLNDYVRALYYDRAGVLWAGTLEGVFRKDGQSFSPFGTRHGLIHPVVRCFHQQEEGTLWIGTDGGITRIHPDGAISQLDRRSGLPTTFIRCIVPADDGGTWVGTYGGGICHVSASDHLTTLTRKNGLYHDIIFDLLNDGKGYLWAGTSKGVFRVPEQEMLDMVHSGLRSLHADIFGEPRNPVRLDVTGGVSPLGLHSRTGQIWFPTYRGAVAFEPHLVEVAKSPPVPVIVSLLVDGADWPMAEKQHLPAGSDRLEFHYSSLTFRAPGKIRYAHMLIGHDQDWIQAGSRRIGFYNSLGPGTFTFQVRAESADGSMASLPASLSFSIRPSFRQTPLFYGLVTALLVFLPLAAMFWRERYLRARGRWLKHQVAERTKELEKANSSLAEAAEHLKSTRNQLVESAHLAGMAEIATDVLHNVGNTLNSVNVSASMIDQGLKRQRVDLLSQASQLLKNQPDLPLFLASATGQRFPDFLDGLARNFEESSALLRQECLVLQERIDNIRETVSSQQKYASLGFEEDLDVNGLLRDSLRVLQDGITARGISVALDLAECPLIASQKSRLFQVFINLIKNGIEALEEAPARQLHLSTRVNPPFLQVEVADTGCGIPGAHLGRLFSYGFTTKRDGHGFGLHFCANAASELGGSLQAFSEGEGRGARFVLTLPLGSGREARLEGTRPGLS
jgi:signal transduction histidine kinase